MVDEGSFAGSLRTGMRVRVEGRSEEFIVLRVDHAQQTADLLSSGSVRQVLEDVPWTALLDGYER